MKIIKNLIIAMRPKQWTKNLLLFAGIIFSGNLSRDILLLKSISGFIIFCLLSGSVYLINDIHDMESDKNHPRKKKRPIASGALPVPAAITATIIFTLISFVASFFINVYFGICAIIYFVMIFSYSVFLKHVVIIDIMLLALGFVIRAIAGIQAIRVPDMEIKMTPWFIICTMFLALFIGICKRRHEIVLLNDDASSHRPVLDEYSTAFLDQMVAVTTSATVISYALWTSLSEISGKHQNWLVYTLPFVIYGIFRYLYITYKREEGGAPEETLLKDKLLLGNIFLWLISVILILYFNKR